MVCVCVCAQGFFVEPTIAEVPSDCVLLQEEVFAPIMYVVKVNSLDHAIQLNNDVPQVTPNTLHTHRLDSNCHGSMGQSEGNKHAPRPCPLSSVPWTHSPLTV